MSGERYRQQVADIAEAFTFEDCEECGDGLDQHVIAPDMFGNAHVWCWGEWEA